MNFCRLLVCSAVLSLGARAVTISNGVSGVGAWSVDISGGGFSSSGNLTYAPGQTTDLIYGLGNYFRTSASGSFSGLSAANPTVTGPNKVQSAGVINGVNGDINVIVTNYINPGSSILNTQVDFTSTNPFGFLEFVNYLDEDVLGSGNDNVVLFGTPGTNSFQLLTVDADTQVGVAHTTNVNAINASYAGFGVHVCCGVFTTGISGPATSDGRYPGQTAYGPMDGTSNFNFILNPNATSATLLFGLGGSPQGLPVEVPAEAPEPATLLMSSVALLCVTAVRRMRQ